MGKFVYFTSAEKRQANEVDLPSFLRDRGEKLLLAGREYRLASDHSITVRGAMWYDHAAQRGGHAISFVQQFYGKSYPEAVTMLLGRDGQSIIPIAKQEPDKTLCTAGSLSQYAAALRLPDQAQVHRPGCGHRICTGETSL